MPPKPTDDDEMDDDLDLDEDTRKVPYSRLQKAIRRMRTAEKRVKELEAAADEWDTERAALTQERDSLRTRGEEWELERAAVAAGLTDPEGLDLARLAYNRLKPEDRPRGGIAGWLKDREHLPRGVRAYLPDPEGEDKGKAKNEATNREAAIERRGQRTELPNPDRGIRQTGATGQPHSSGEVTRMSAQDYASQRESIWRGMGMRPPSGIPGLARKDTPSSE